MEEFRTKAARKLQLQPSSIFSNVIKKCKSEIHDYVIFMLQKLKRLRCKNEIAMDEAVEKGSEWRRAKA